MRSKIPVLATLCLLTACGRVGEVAQPPSQSVLERAQPAETAPQQQAQAPAAPAAQQTEAPRTPMPTADALTDTAITERIAAALQADPAMKGADVSINTDSGVVVLSGTVRSHEQTGVASAHAQRQDGVLRVDNHLRPQYS